MVKRLLLLIINCFFLFLLLGCWSKKEFDEIALIMGMGIDKSEQNYSLSIQVAIPTEISGSKSIGIAPVNVYSAEGVSPCDAFRRIVYQLPRKPYIAHVIAIIISEEVAKEGVTEVIDCFSRDNEIRKTTQILIAKGVKASEILSQLTSLERIPVNKMTKVVVNVETNYSIMNVVKLHTFISDLVSDGKSAVVPGISVLGDVKAGNEKSNNEKAEQPAKLKLANYAVFNKDKLIGWLDEETSKAVTHISGQVNGTMIGARCAEGVYNMLQTSKVNTKLKANVDGEKPSITIRHEIMGEICQAGCDIDLTSVKEVEAMEKEFEVAVKQLLENSVKKVQTEVKTDIFGFGDLIHQSYPNYWKKVKDDWDREFETLDVQVEVKVKVDRPGYITKSFGKDVK